MASRCGAQCARSSLTISYLTEQTGHHGAVVPASYSRSGCCDFPAGSAGWTVACQVKFLCSFPCSDSAVLIDSSQILLGSPARHFVRFRGADSKLGGREAGQGCPETARPPGWRPNVLRTGYRGNDFLEEAGYAQKAHLPQLVAIAGADGDLVTALGATTAQDRGSGLGLHAAQKAMGLGAATTVGLKGTLRHETNSSEAGDDLPDLFSCCSNF